ncbi:putative metallo-beta-lactamase, ribonuclease Z/Hydroxyacylglutathione hydrolase [Helianthus annuus]|nr:putative metallo-beta-lactamase, ribonuclease Z/Hydroxyacylglutathione hydrolase [Helianthus annuus]
MVACWNIKIYLLCNTSLLIDYCPSGGEHKYILIDVGKTFREQVLRWFTFHKIPQIDSIVLTHEHADAVLGLDDIRAVQPFSPVNEIEPTPIFLNQHAMDREGIPVQLAHDGLRIPIHL